METTNIQKIVQKRNTPVWPLLKVMLLVEAVFLLNDKKAPEPNSTFSELVNSVFRHRSFIFQLAEEIWALADLLTKQHRFKEARLINSMKEAVEVISLGGALTSHCGAHFNTLNSLNCRPSGFG